MVFTIIRALRKQDRINPVFIKRSTLLIRNESIGVADLKIEYKGNTTENFTITNFAIWNAGKKTIRSEDIASLDKIRIEAVGSVKILDAILLKRSVEENKFEKHFNPKTNNVELSFEYLDYNHGAAIQIFHTGKSSNDVDVRGTFKSHGKIVSFENETKKAIMNEVLENPAKNFIPSKDDKKVLFRVFLIVSFIFFGVAFFYPHFGLRQ